MVTSYRNLFNGVMAFRDLREVLYSCSSSTLPRYPASRQLPENRIRLLHWPDLVSGNALSFVNLYLQLANGKQALHVEGDTILRHRLRYRIY